MARPNGVSGCQRPQRTEDFAVTVRGLQPCRSSGITFDECAVSDQHASAERMARPSIGPRPRCRHLGHPSPLEFPTTTRGQGETRFVGALHLPRAARDSCDIEPGRLLGVWCQPVRPPATKKTCKLLPLSHGLLAGVAVLPITLPCAILAGRTPPSAD